MFFSIPQNSGNEKCTGNLMLEHNLIIDTCWPVCLKSMCVSYLLTATLSSRRLVVKFGRGVAGPLPDVA